MGYSLPSIPSVKIPEPDLNSALSQLSAAYDPSSTVTAVSDNVTSQQASIETVRAQLESTRQSAQKASANADLASMSSYTAGLNNMTDAACVMASTKPALTPMTPDSLSNPLASVSLDSTSGILTEEELATGILGNCNNLAAVAGEQAGIDPAVLQAAASGDVATLTSPNTLTDLTVAGAGAYASGMTGGIIPPAMASAVVGAVAGSTINSTLSLAQSGDLLQQTASSGQITDLASNVKLPDLGSNAANLVGSAAVAVGGMALNYATQSNVDLTRWTGLNLLQNAIGTDAAGSLLTGVTEQVIVGTVGLLDNSLLSQATGIGLGTLAGGVLSSLCKCNPGHGWGGIQTDDAVSVATGMALNAVQKFAGQGLIDGVSNLAGILTGTYGIPKESAWSYVQQASTTMPQTECAFVQMQKLVEEYEPVGHSCAYITDTDTGTSTKLDTGVQYIAERSKLIQNLKQSREITWETKVPVVAASGGTKLKLKMTFATAASKTITTSVSNKIEVEETGLILFGAQAASLAKTPASSTSPTYEEKVHMYLREQGLTPSEEGNWPEDTPVWYSFTWDWNDAEDHRQGCTLASTPSTEIPEDEKSILVNILTGKTYYPVVPTYECSYRKTPDTKIQSSKVYYQLVSGSYVEAEVVPGTKITSKQTYYEYSSELMPTVSKYLGCSEDTFNAYYGDMLKRPATSFLQWDQRLKTLAPYGVMWHASAEPNIWIFKPNGSSKLYYMDATCAAWQEVSVSSYYGNIPSMITDNVVARTAIMKDLSKVVAFDSADQSAVVDAETKAESSVGQLKERLYGTDEGRKRKALTAIANNMRTKEASQYTKAARYFTDHDYSDESYAAAMA